MSAGNENIFKIFDNVVSYLGHRDEVRVAQDRVEHECLKKKAYYKKQVVGEARLLG